MSMNIRISAEADAVITKTGKKVRISKKFNTYQTPTKVTDRIMSKKDKIGEYKKWVKENDFVEEEGVYAEYDVLFENPIEYKKVDYGELHIKDLEYFIEKYTKDGYEIKVMEI